MLTNVSRAALELPADERLELARRLVESVVEPAPLNDAVIEGIRRIEDIAAGCVEGLTEEQYRAYDEGHFSPGISERHPKIPS